LSGRFQRFRGEMFFDGIDDTCPSSAGLPDEKIGKASGEKWERVIEFLEGEKRIVGRERRAKECQRAGLVPRKKK
jgi:hypothetical protein